MPRVPRVPGWRAGREGETKGEPRAGKAPLGTAIAVLASLGMLVNSLVTDPRDTGITLLVIVIGIPIYYVWRAFTLRRAGAP